MMEPDQESNNEPFVYTAVFFNFGGEQDRNVRTNWPGEIPRVGEMVQLKGRDTIWKIRELRWIFDIEPKEQRFQRAAIIHLEKIT